MKTINYQNTSYKQFVSDLNSEMHSYNSRNKDNLHITETNHKLNFKFAKEILELKASEAKSILPCIAIRTTCGG